MQLSIRFIVCSLSIASTATTASTTSASEMTKLLIVAARSVAGLVADCAAHCCSPSTGWSSVVGSKLRSWSPAGEPTTTIVVTSLEASSVRPDIAATRVATDCFVVVTLDCPFAFGIAEFFSSEAFATLSSTNSSSAWMSLLLELVDSQKGRTGS
jgi:hypothetical protein